MAVAAPREREPGREEPLAQLDDARLVDGEEVVVEEDARTPSAARRSQRCIT
jgi:hypothetical protein